MDKDLLYIINKLEGILENVETLLLSNGKVISNSQYQGLLDVKDLLIKLNESNQC